MAERPIHAFVAGHPIAHSRSPMIHGHWLARYGIPGAYKAVDVAPADFPAFVAGFRANGYAGGNVTIPHKETAYRCADWRDEAAEVVGAVNTLWLEDGRVCGGNTDVHGFQANLDERAPGWTKAGPALLIGAGGAARAAIHALLLRGFTDIRVVNRTIDRARELVDNFGAAVSAHGLEATRELAADAGLLVNTTSVGMDDASGLAADPAWLPSHAIVHDAVYVPLMTPLLSAAASRGLRTVDGLGMLLHQAAPAFARWFGRTPEVTPELRALVVADIEGHR